MNMILSFVKSYFIFVLLLQIISYLTPRDSYRKYVNFFTGVLLVALLLRPVFTFCNETQLEEIRIQMDDVEKELEKIQYEGEELDLFEIFMGENL